MGFLLSKIVSPLLLPPGINLVLAVAGLLLARRRARATGITLLVLSLASLYFLSIPIVGGAALHSLEVYPALEDQALKNTDAQAIVVLGGGRYAVAPEYGGDTVSRLTLERVRYAARLQRKTGLPLLTSGGQVLTKRKPEASLMREVLVDEFDVPVRWTEINSRNTAENARLSASLLARNDVKKVLLVTHAWHLPRAVAAFERAGIEVVPAPTAFNLSRGDDSAPWIFDWLPQAGALRASNWACHEYLGRLWYWLRY